MLPFSLYSTILDKYVYMCIFVYNNTSQTVNYSNGRYWSILLEDDSDGRLKFWEMVLNGIRDSDNELF